MYRVERPTLSSLALMPEWYLVIAILATLGALGLLWGPLLALLPIAAGAAAVMVAQAVAGARRAARARTGPRRVRYLALTTVLHLLQPLARLSGRLRSGLTPWRARGPRVRALPRPTSWTVWSESWRSLECWVEALEQALREHGTVVTRGGDFDRWDLELRGGLIGRARILSALEEHGHGRQLVRFRLRPRPLPGALLTAVLLAAVAAAAQLSGATHAAAALGLLLALTLAATVAECAHAAGSAGRAAGRLRDDALRHAREDANDDEPAAIEEAAQAARIGVRRA